MVTEVLSEEKEVIPVEPVQMYCKHTLSRSKSNVIDAKKAVTDPNPYICKYLPMCPVTEKYFYNRRVVVPMMPKGKGSKE